MYKKMREVSKICNKYPYSCVGIVVFEVAGLMRHCAGTLIYGNLVLTSAITCYNQYAREYINVKNMCFVLP